MLMRMQERNEPAVFYHALRHCLSGYPAGVLDTAPHLLVRSSSPQGASAAQSSLFVALDIFLGVTHV